MQIREIFARNLRKQRTAHKLSQEALADRADLDRTYISALERCRFAPTIEVLDRLAKALGLEAGDLLREAEQTSKTAKSQDPENNN